MSPTKQLKMPQVIKEEGENGMGENGEPLENGHTTESSEPITDAEVTNDESAISEAPVEETNGTSEE